LFLFDTRFKNYNFSYFQSFQVILIHELIEYAVTEFSESQSESTHPLRGEFLFPSESDPITHMTKSARDSHTLSRVDEEVDECLKEVKIVTKRKRKENDRGIVAAAKRRKTADEREMEREEKDERDESGEEAERSKYMRASKGEGEGVEEEKGEEVRVDGKVLSRDQMRRKRLERSLRAIYVISLCMESLFHRFELPPSIFLNS
jgi:hypothetical protein